MGEIKKHPRYNVLSFRVSDEELQVLEVAQKKCACPTRQDLIRRAMFLGLEIIENANERIRNGSRPSRSN